MHACRLEHSQGSNFDFKYHCALCNRRRKCYDSVSLWGRQYNRTSLRMTKNEILYLGEEKEAQLREVTGEDGSPGVEFYVGPTCSQRLFLYHELHHYKVQLYQTITEEFNHLMDKKLWNDKFEKAQKGPKNRVIGEDLEILTTQIFDYLKEGKC